MIANGSLFKGVQLSVVRFQNDRLILRRRSRLHLIDSDTDSGFRADSRVDGNTEWVERVETFRDEKFDVLSTFGDTRIDILKIDIEGAEFLIQDELISG